MITMLFPTPEWRRRQAANAAALLLCAHLGSGPVAAETTAESALLPVPLHVAYSGGRLGLRGRVQLLVPTDAPQRVGEIAELLCHGLNENQGVNAAVGPTAATGRAVTVSLRLEPADVDPEAYRLTIGDTVEIAASNPRGLLWGAQTLLQSVEIFDGSPVLRCGEIRDRPARQWRGLMLDPVRSWLDLDFIRRTVQVMSAYKLNVLHLHLIDDQAWRFESKAWPKCNRPGEPLYTQAELKELVAFAARYGIEIVPEFDMPGHSMTAVNAYPELDCERQSRTMNEAIFCAGRPFTWEFIDKLVAEAADVFPSRYLHLGADEPYPIKRWATCPDCQARMKAKGATSLEAAYHTFVTDLDGVAQRHGKTLIVWNDAIHPGVEPMPPKDIIIDGWVNFESVGPLATAGYVMLNSSSGPLYLTSYGLREGLPLSAVLSWDAMRFAYPRAKRGDTSLKYAVLPPNAIILGGHAAAWATEQRLTERRLYPRLLAVAEDLWSEGHAHDATEFEARFSAGHLARLRRLGVPDDDRLPVEQPFGSAAGAIVSPGAAPAGWLTSERSYRDFSLSFELRASTAGARTGVFIRCAPGAPPAGFPIVAAPPPGWIMTRGLLAANGWNRFEVVARGSVIALTINGGLAWSVVDPAPRTGAIVLRDDGGNLQFRNLQLRNLEGK